MKDTAFENFSTTDLNQNQSNAPTSDFWLTIRTNVRLKQQTPPIQSFPRNGKLQLTLNQERLWSLEKLQPDSSVHNLLHTFHIRGLLNVVALEQSLSAIVQRHEILRTVFPTVDGQPVQHITADVDFHLPVIDLQHLSPKELEVTVQKLTIKQSEQPFDLTKVPLWRFELLHLGAEEYILNRTIHHIIFDGWSHNVFLRELGVLYEAFSTGKSSLCKLPPLSIHYADFAQTHRQWLETRVFASQLDYWKQQLGNNVAALDLPTNRPRSKALSYQGECLPVILSEELTTALKTLSFQQGVTLFVTLLAAFKTLLHHYTGQDDILVCSPVACRHQLETKGLIGYFNNVLVLRTNLSSNLSFRELLSRVSQVTLGAYANQDVSLQQLAQLPSLARIPLTRAMFVLHNTPSPTLNLDGLTIDSHYVERPVANFDWSLSMQEKERKLTGVLQYKTDLFDTSSIVQVLENFQTLLEQIVATPDRCLADLLYCYPTKPQDHLTSFSSSPKEPFVPPRDEVELQLKNIWEDTLSIRPIGIRDNIFALGGNSLLALRLCDRIEETFNKKLPLLTIFQSPTIEKLATILRQKEWLQPSYSLTPIQPNGSKLPLFLCEGVGIYYPLIPYLGSEQPVYGLVAGSREGNPIQYERLEELASHYITEIQTLQPQGPYFLGGISWGGVIAFEIAQQLVAQGHKIGLLAFFDTIRPGAYQANPTGVRIFWHLKNLLQKGPVYFLDKVGARYQKNLKNVRNAGSKFVLDNPMMPVPQNEEHFAMRQAFNQACQNYMPKIYSGKITIFRAKDRPDAGAYHVDPGLGWSALAGGGIEIHDISGDHLGILKEPHVQILAKKLMVCLQQAQVDISKNL